MSIPPFPAFRSPPAARRAALAGILSLLALGLSAAPLRGMELVAATLARSPGAAPAASEGGTGAAAEGRPETLRLLPSPPTSKLGPGLTVELPEGKTSLAPLRSGAGFELLDEAAGFVALLRFDEEGFLSGASVREAPVARESPPATKTAAGGGSPERSGSATKGGAELLFELRRYGNGAGELVLRDAEGALLARAELLFGDPRLAGGIRYARFLDAEGVLEAELELHADASGRLSALSIRRAAAEAAQQATAGDAGGAGVAGGAGGAGGAGVAPDRPTGAEDAATGGSAAGADDPLALLLSLFPALDPLGPFAAASREWGSGFVSTSSSFLEEGSIAYAYDAEGRPALALSRNPSGLLVERLSLRYDERGLLVEELREPGPTAALKGAGAEAVSPPAAPLRLVHSYELGPDGAWRIRLSYELRADRGGENRLLVQRLERRPLR